jgi:hypothetical protein
MTIYFQTWCPGDSCDPCTAQYTISAAGDFVESSEAGSLVGTYVPILLHTIISATDSGGILHSYNIDLSGGGIYPTGGWTAIDSSLFFPLADYSISVASIAPGDLGITYVVTSIEIHQNVLRRSMLGHNLPLIRRFQGY